MKLLLIVLGTCGLLSAKVVAQQPQEELPSVGLPSAKPDWEQLARPDYGFKIAYPKDWVIEYTEQGIEIFPKTNPSVFDADLQRQVASPGINITLAGPLPDQNVDAVSQFVQLRPNGYKSYEYVKNYQCHISYSIHATCYEFQYNAGQIQFTALSIVAQRNDRLFNVTASARSLDFEKFRSTISAIVFSFELLK